MLTPGYVLRIPETNLSWVHLHSLKLGREAKHDGVLAVLDIDLRMSVLDQGPIDFLSIFVAGHQAWLLVLRKQSASLLFKMDRKNGNRIHFV